MRSHYLLRDGCAVYDDDGNPRHLVSKYYVGRAKCQCGAISDKGISKVAARDWFRKHTKEDTA